MIPALVLTAGLATRLRPLSFVRAKAALPVAGEALARRVLRSLAMQGVTDAVLNLHHLPHTLTAVVGDGSDLGVRVRYSWEMPLLGSAGGPKRAVPLLTRFAHGDATFLIVNGDTLTDVDLPAVVEHHRVTGALVTMAVVQNTEPEKYGGAIVDGDGIVTGFARRGSRQASFHFVGIQVAEAEAFASVPRDAPYESVGALYPALIASRRGAIRAFRTTAEFLDIGTPADYLATSMLIAEREGRETNGGLASPVPSHRPARAQIDAGARIERSVLWDDVVVEAGAFLRECVVTDGVRVPADTSWTGVTIRPATSDLMPGERRVDGLAIASL